MAEIEKRYIKVSEAIVRYATSSSTIYRAFSAGQLTKHRRGGTTLICIEEGDRWAAGEAVTTVSAK